ncbi:MAG: hypothetical protein IJI47_00665 [Eubacterium sp.]|nr:hypothetical protein [Eubacterium sp.]MBR0412067.1 hypothetical protein [Eubacterium sp.]
MRVIQCPNGHYFDADSYAHCPHCNEVQTQQIPNPSPDFFANNLDSNGVPFSPAMPAYASPDVMSGNNNPPAGQYSYPLPQVPDDMPMTVYASPDVMGACYPAANMDECNDVYAGPDIMGAFDDEV